MKQRIHSFQQGDPERSRMGSPLSTRSTLITVVTAMMLLFAGCCAPAATSSTTLQETAFTATFVGFTADGQYLLAKPEQSKDSVQLVYDKAENLVIGQRLYVVGRLEGHLVYVTNLRPL